MDIFSYWKVILSGIVVLISVLIMVRTLRSDEARRPGKAHGDSHKDFKINVGRSVFRGIDCFSVICKGELNFGPRSENYRVVLHLLDVTSAPSGEPVFCQKPHLHKDDTLVFEYRSDAQEIPSLANNVKFKHAIRIPISSLVLPYSGKRKLRFSAEIKLNVRPAQPPRSALDDLGTLATASSDYTYDNKQSGYKEQTDGRIAAALRLAAATAKCDGKLEQNEQQIIEKWCREIAMTYNASSHVAMRLYKAAREACQETLDPWEAAFAAALKLRAAPEDKKLAVLELCAKVARANRKTATSEIKLLTLAAKAMRANTEHVAAIMGEHLPIHASSSSTVGNMLGITPNMSKEEKKKQLTEMFRIWNRRTDSADPEIKKKAKQMLDCIAAEHQKVTQQMEQKKRQRRPRSRAKKKLSK